MSADNCRACAATTRHPNAFRPCALHPSHDLTPSQIALAKMLAAYVEWAETDFTSRDAQAFGVVGAVVEVLIRANLLQQVLLDIEPTGEGRDLLDRARKAGVVV